MMRRIIAALITISMLFVSVLVCNAETITVISEDDYIHVDYQEFHSNREYYDKLLLQGFAICVYVGDTYADTEVSRFTQSTNTLHTLIPSGYSRGTSIPTAEYDIHLYQNYAFTCNADYETLYTNYKFYGCYTYLIDGYNEHYDNNLRVRVWGTSKGTIDFYVPPRSTIYKVIGTTTTADRFFAGFYPPSRAYGEIYCIGH